MAKVLSNKSQFRQNYLNQINHTNHTSLHNIKMANNEESRGLKSLFDWFANRRKSGSSNAERQERKLLMVYGINALNVVF